MHLYRHVYYHTQAEERERERKEGMGSAGRAQSTVKTFGTSVSNMERSLGSVIFAFFFPLHQLELRVHVL